MTFSESASARRIVKTQLRLSADLQTLIMDAATHSDRSMNAEIVHRLASTFQPASGPAQQSLDLAPPSPALADQFDTAARVFSSALQVAERMHIGDKRALRFALDHTRRTTGIDWDKELQLAAPATSQAALPMVAAQFLAAWQSGALALPWAPTLSTDLHAAFSRWCAREKTPALCLTAFAGAAARCGQLTAARKRWRVGETCSAPASFILPLDVMRPAGPAETDWLGCCVTAFRKAAKRARLST